MPPRQQAAWAPVPSPEPSPRAGEVDFQRDVVALLGLPFDVIDMNGAVRYWASQLIGATAAGFVCLMIFSRGVVADGTPQLAGSVGPMKGIVIEAILTFFLVFVIFGTGIDARGPKIGGLAIGLAVTMDIMFGGPLTGAAMNPAQGSGRWTT